MSKVLVGLIKFRHMVNFQRHSFSDSLFHILPCWLSSVSTLSPQQSYLCWATFQGNLEDENVCSLTLQKRKQAKQDTKRGKRFRRTSLVQYQSCFRVKLCCTQNSGRAPGTVGWARLPELASNSWLHMEGQYAARKAVCRVQQGQNDNKTSTPCISGPKDAGLHFLSHISFLSHSWLERAVGSFPFDHGQFVNCV